jgi:hypothetical protein
MNKENDVLGSLRIKKPVLIPGLGKIFWSTSYRSSKYTKEVDFLDSNYVPHWVTHFCVPKVNNVLESDFQYFNLDLRLEKPFEMGVYNWATKDVNSLLGTTDVQYIANGNNDATLDQLSLPEYLVLSLESMLSKFNGESMLCQYYSMSGDDPLLVKIEFIHCETSKMQRDDLLMTIASMLIPH